jgi:hypothetical protein
MSRVPKNAQGPDVAAWIIEAHTMTAEPSATHFFRPKASAKYEAGMKLGVPPRETPAIMRPSMLELMSPRSCRTAVD